MANFLLSLQLTKIKFYRQAVVPSNIILKWVYTQNVQVFTSHNYDIEITLYLRKKQQQTRKITWN